MQRPLGELICGSFLVYPSTGDSALAREVRTAAWAIKEDKRRDDGQPWIEYTVRRLVEKSTGTPLEHFLDGAVLVPVPGSKKTLPDDPALIKGPVLWAAERICEALLDQHLGQLCSACVIRTTTVESSKNIKGPRSPLRHMQSLALVPDVDLIPDNSRLIVVDDIVTSGSTMLATAALALEAYPGREVFGFALFGTETYLRGEVVRPVLQRITWSGKGSPRRRDLPARKHLLNIER